MRAPATGAGGGELNIPSSSVAQTQAIAARLAPLLGPGDLILLGGELGAGKTAFVQGLARAMGVREAVTSPTFTLMRSYDASAGSQLIHADVYRLDHLREMEDLGLVDFVDEGAIGVIEWGQAVVPVLPREYLEVRLDFGDGEDDRQITVSGRGARWTRDDVASALREALGG